MAARKAVEFQDMLPAMARKLGGEGLIRELCNGFELLKDGDKRVITCESLRRNAGILGLEGFSDEELQGMIGEGDLDGDGALNVLEFCVLMFRLSPQLMTDARALLREAFPPDLA
ncbi:calcium-binding protein KIC-like [Diospyros lotus]|uniref:calcium-binding protein KIC-like n=1 Tax=Diospyros lotus TaxID=55363 RepID=UPI00225348E2|nr:calcium-binding protein KIC-like [Diospyros lotus]